MLDPVGGPTSKKSHALIKSFGKHIHYGKHFSLVFPTDRPPIIKIAATYRNIYDSIECQFIP